MTRRGETARSGAAGAACPLLAGLDHVEWDAREVAEIAAAIRRERPLWLRAANFFSRTLELLRLLDRPRLVLWKLEFWGMDTPFDKVPASPGVDPAGYAEELLSLGHHVVPYAFNTWNRERLVAMVPALERRSPALLPVAQKPAVASQSRGAVRRRLGLGREDVLVGAGGLWHPAKGIEEIVRAFLRTWPDPRAHLLCSLVVEDEEDTAAAVRRRWADAFGEAGLDRVHVRVGPYGQWPWMCAFYRAIDVMLVNSVSDSWGRMVSEALGFGVPTLVRRADCATNHIAPGVVLVDGFDDLGAPVFAAAVRAARARASALAGYVAGHYGVEVVRGRWLALLRAETPPHRRAVFDRAVADPASRRVVDELIVY